jgi:TRAP-type C4-dicarboxylate transport system permease large subunit
MIIYGTVANVSIEQLFIAGIGPGILIGVGLMLVSSRLAGRYRVQLEEKKGWRDILRATRSALGTILLALLIFAVILGGVFTATEASAVAVVYALVVGLFVHRQLKVRDLPRIFVAAGKTTAALSFVLACAALFAWTLGIGKVPEIVTAALLNGTDGFLGTFASGADPATFALLQRIAILLVLNISLLLIGAVLDVAPALLIVVPVLLPVSDAIGMGSGLAAIQFGVMVVTNLVIGLVTPPIGTTLFVAAGIGKVEVPALVPHVLRLLGVMVAVQLLVTFVSPITTFLPSLMQP